MKRLLFIFCCLLAGCVASFPVSKKPQYDLWIYAKYVVTNNGVLKNKYVGLTDEGLIGSITDQKPENATVIDGSKHILAPGFINAHDHITYNYKGPFENVLPAYIDSHPDRYNHRLDWGAGCRGYKMMPTGRTYRPEFLIWSELRQVVAGTTTILSTGGYPGFARNIGSYSPDEGLILPKKIWNETFPLKENIEKCKYQLATGDNYPAHPRNIEDIIYVIHVAEGKDAVARNEFVNMSVTEGRKIDILGENTGLIHMVGILEKDVAKVAKAKATVIWSPRSNFALYGMTAPVSLMKDYGINIALGTDWTQSGSAHVLDELKVASSYNKKYLNALFTNKELWQMATVNPAKFLQLSDQIGDIKPGMQADLVLYAVGDQEYKTDEEIYGALIEMNPKNTELVMRGGAPLFGRWSLLDGIVSFEKRDIGYVFGKEYYISGTVETGYPYARLRRVNTRAKNYPLFPDLNKKKTPIDYPVSLKNRLSPESTSYSGKPTSADPDGDGIAKDDNASKIFNPVRPVDITDNQARQINTRLKKNAKK